MPFEINIGQPPGGYAMTSARPGENIQVICREFTSTEDGQYFIQRLEGFPSDLIAAIPNPVKPSQVDSLLAIMHLDGTATIYLNEVPLVAIARSTGPVEAGSPVYKDDIADIERLQLPLTIPDDAGFMYLFSVGWRKGLFYDYGPLGPGHEPRQYDYLVLLGNAVAHVFFQERFAITDREWEKLFDQRWFPFVGLRNHTIASLLNHVRSDWNCDDLLDIVVDEVKERAGDMLVSWRKHPTLSQHIEFLDRGVERFLSDDPMSCVSNVYPRIEGIVRSYVQGAGSPDGTSQRELANLAVRTKIENERSLLLPQRFEHYLNDVYFAAFNPQSDNIPLSRNSLGHGVAKATDFDKKSAVLGLLTVHQLFYFL